MLIHFTYQYEISLDGQVIKWPQTKALAYLKRKFNITNMRKFIFKSYTNLALNGAKKFGTRAQHEIIVPRDVGGDCILPFAIGARRRHRNIVQTSGWEPASSAWIAASDDVVVAV